MTTTTTTTTQKNGKTSLTSSNGLSLIEGTEIWKTIFDKYKIPKSQVEILVVASTRKDADYLISNKYKVDYITPNNINTNKKVYDIVIATSVNKYMLEEDDRNEMLFYICERLRATGDAFLVLANKDDIYIEWEQISRSSVYSVYFT